MLKFEEEKVRAEMVSKRISRSVTAAAALLGVAAATPAFADFSTAMDAWLKRDYVHAMTELVPVAESGNATAQELIGVLHALGLGVPQDREKAFAWYLRAAENGHAGAQSGVGWYYEVGLGGAPVDLVLAHTWYTVSAVGGDIDAAVSVTEVEKKMSGEQIDAAQLAARELLGR